jgi:hypothetical protein
MNHQLTSPSLRPLLAVLVYEYIVHVPGRGLQTQRQGHPPPLPHLLHLRHPIQELLNCIAIA